MLMNAIGISIFKKEETLYFYDILKNSVEMRLVLTQYGHGHKLEPMSYLYVFRKEGKHRRNDLIDLMVDAMNDNLHLENEKDEEEFELNTKTSYK